MQRHSFRTLFISLALSAPTVLVAQGDPAVVARIIDEGKTRSQVMRILRELCYDIGPRLTGSLNIERGEQWAMRKFRSWGLQNVHLEEWGEIPVGFQRGRRSFGRMVAPFQSDFQFTSPSWTRGTDGPLRGRAFLLPASMADFERMKQSLRGAWVVTPGAAGRGAPPMSDDQRAMLAELENLDVAGRVSASRNELVITSGSWRDKTYEKHPMLRQAIVRRSDMDRIMRSLERGREVVLEFNLDQRFIRGPLKEYNIVAEIPGSEKPDEVVIVSGHFDTWDGPGSQGACDNGTGVSTAMEAARILMAVGAKPKRTIRFVLWGGEEQGLHGSRAYVQQHRDELDKISAVFVDDGGTNYHGGYEGIASQQAMLEAAFAPTAAAFPELPMKMTVRPAMPRGGGSDHAPFNAAGVPGFFTEETGRSDYTYVHHTQHDKVEMAIPEYLVQSATNHAVVSYNIASAATLLPRAPRAPGGG